MSAERQAIERMEAEEERNRVEAELEALTKERIEIQKDIDNIQSMLQSEREAHMVLFYLLQI